MMLEPEGGAYVDVYQFIHRYIFSLKFLSKTYPQWSAHVKETGR